MKKSTDREIELRVSAEAVATVGLGVNGHTIFVSKPGLSLLLKHMSEDTFPHDRLHIQQDGRLCVTNGKVAAWGNAAAVPLGPWDGLPRSVGIERIQIKGIHDLMKPMDVLAITVNDSRISGMLYHRGRGGAATGKSIVALSEIDAEDGTFPPLDRVMATPKRGHDAGTFCANTSFLAAAYRTLTPLSMRETRIREKTVWMPQVFTRIYGELEPIHVSTHFGEWLVVIMPMRA